MYSRKQANGKCEACEKPGIHGNAHYCEDCRRLFTLQLELRKLKRKIPKQGYKRIMAKIKYTEVLEVMSRS